MDTEKDFEEYRNPFFEVEVDIKSTSMCVNTFLGIYDEIKHPARKKALLDILKDDDRIAIEKTLESRRKHKLAWEEVGMENIRKATDEEIQGFCEKYIHFNVTVEVPRPGSLPAYHPAVMSYSVVKAYWDAYCYENNYNHIIADKMDLIDYLKREYGDSGLQFVDDQEKIVFAMIKRDMVKKELH